MRKAYGTGFDSAYEIPDEREPGSDRPRVSDGTIMSVAMRQGISVEAARRRLTGMDRLNQAMSGRYGDDDEFEADGPEY